MQQGRDPISEIVGAFKEGLRQIGDCSYAIMPKDVAHSLADFKKAVLAQITTCLQWEMEWIDNRVAGGDKLREEWREKCERNSQTAQ